METKEIHIKFVPHSEQRLNTNAGDYFYDGNKLMIIVSDLGDEYKNRLIALHELIEEAITKKHGIDEPTIQAFDTQWEIDKANGLKDNITECGLDQKAPYYKEHLFSDAIERLFAQQLDIDWNEYEKQFLSL